jgi:hypothetical protein
MKRCHPMAGDATRRTVALGGNPPQTMSVYEYTDGTVVRYKPMGDKERPTATFSIEVKKDASLPDTGPTDAAFKVDRDGQVVPK